jgi:Nucleotidyltransferase domain
VIAEALEPLTDSIQVAFIFGSVARGTETQGSDVDLMIIGSVDFGVVVDALHLAQQQLSRDISPKVFTSRDGRNRLEGRDPFLTEVGAGKKLFLIGGENGLEELGRHQP